MKKAFSRKIITFIVGVIGGIIVIGGVAFGIFAYRNLHWYDKKEKSIKEAGAVEKQAVLPSKRTINYGEVENDKPALLLIHGQMSSWEDYGHLLPKLSENWHVYAVDLYGHGQSSHEEELYYIDVNGDDLIWFIDHVIGEKTVVSGHSNGALEAAYIAAYGGENIAGVVLEDPPVFSTQGENWENSFAYLDTYKPLHEYNSTNQTDCWPAYYLRHCYWGQLFMKDSMQGIGNYAQMYSKKHPGEEVKIFFLPPSAIEIFHYVVDYDFNYGEHFYDLSWNNGYTHEQILTDIEVPCIYLHAKENLAETGVYLCAASREQAERAAAYIGNNCRLVEMDTSDHVIHSVHEEEYLEAVNSLWTE